MYLALKSFAVNFTFYFSLLASKFFSEIILNVIFPLCTLLLCDFSVHKLHFLSCMLHGFSRLPKLPFSPHPSEVNKIAI